MVIQFDDVIKAIESGNVKKVQELRDCLDSILDDYKKKSYIEVQILNRSGNICKQIRQKFPKFTCHWSSGGNPGTIGTNYVWIPSDMWNEQVKSEISKFDDFVGHQVESITAYKLKPDVEVPASLKNDLKYRAELNHVNLYDLALNSFELKNSFRVSPQDLKNYFNEVKIITKEWDNELWVYDDRDYSGRNIDRYKGRSIEI